MSIGRTPLRIYPCGATKAALFHYVDEDFHTAEGHGLKHGFTILGSKGCITLDTNPWLPPEDNSFTVEIYETFTREVKVEAQGDGFHYQVRNIRQAVERGDTQLTSPMATHQDSRVIMKLLTDWEQAAS